MSTLNPKNLIKSGNWTLVLIDMTCCSKQLIGLQIITKFTNPQLNINVEWFLLVYWFVEKDIVDKFTDNNGGILMILIELTLPPPPILSSSPSRSGEQKESIFLFYSYIEYLNVTKPR